MNELTLIKLTQYAFAVINKPMPKGYVLKACESTDNVVEFFKLEDGLLFENYGKPVGFYFKDSNTFELRNKYDGHTLLLYLIMI